MLFGSCECHLRRALSSSACVYLFACAWYVVMTRGMPTPFADTLTKIQKQIKRESSQIRLLVFSQGVFLGIVMLLYSSVFSSADPEQTDLCLCPFSGTCTERRSVPS